MKVFAILRIFTGHMGEKTALVIKHFTVKNLQTNTDNEGNFVVS